jgi:hypothetical protein
MAVVLTVGAKPKGHASGRTPMLNDKSQFSANAEVELPQIAIDFAPIDLMAGNKRKTS